MSRSPLVKAAWLAAVVFFVGSGMWAFLAPRSFFDVLATWPPYNRHLLHDVGAFSVGIGGALLAALKWRDGLLVALAATSVGSIFHAASHVIDAGSGGKTSDPYLLGLLALFLAAATVARAKEVTP